MHNSDGNNYGLILMFTSDVYQLNTVFSINAQLVYASQQYHRILSGYQLYQTVIHGL